LQKTRSHRKNLENKEIVALIAYLQRLGTDIKVKDLLNNKQPLNLTFMAKYILEGAGNINWMAIFALLTFVHIFTVSALLAFRKIIL
jgi:hypothetical protein